MHTSLWALHIYTWSVYVHVKMNDHLLQILTFDDDPYRKEVETFLEASRSRDDTHIQSSYQDAAKSYQLTWDIRLAGEKKC